MPSVVDGIIRVPVRHNNFVLLGPAEVVLVRLGANVVLKAARKQWKFVRMIVLAGNPPQVVVQDSIAQEDCARDVFALLVANVVLEIMLKHVK